jgi:hypothetical protein
LSGTRPIGQQTISIQYADGTAGTMIDDIYQGWYLTCGTGWVFVNGVPTATTSSAASDVYADCTNANIVFPHGGVLMSNPVQDKYGRYETLFPTLTAAPLFIAQIVNVPMASIAAGEVLGIQTLDGGAAKVYFTSQVNPSPNIGSTTGVSAEGMAMHTNGSGSFDY